MHHCKIAGAPPQQAADRRAKPGRQRDPGRLTATETARRSQHLFQRLAKVGGAESKVRPIEQDHPQLRQGPAFLDRRAVPGLSCPPGPSVPPGPHPGACMNPEEFLELASEWVDGEREGEWRSAVSRAYYAAFHVASQLLTQAGFAVPDSERAHAYLWRRRANSGHPDVQRAGNDFAFLRSMRNRADYDMNRP